MTTGVRVPQGAQLESLNNIEWFLSMLRFDSMGKLDELGIRLDTLAHRSQRFFHCLDWLNRHLKAFSHPWNQ